MINGDWRPQKEICDAYRLDRDFLAKSGLPRVQRGREILYDRQALDRMLEEKWNEFLAGAKKA